MSPGPDPGEKVFRRITAAAAALAAAAVLLIATPAQSAPAATVAGADRFLAAPDIAPLPTSPQPLTRYRIQPGDTLFGIAARFCGSGARYRSLAAGNGISNPDLIYAGATLRMTCAAPVRAIRTTTVAARTYARPSTRAQQVVAFVLAQVGKPYSWGAAGPWAYDCSGLVVAAFARVGVRLPHQSEALMSYGRYVPRSQLQPGDVVQPFLGHVFIYIGGGRIVEAADPSQGVRLNSLYAYATARRYV